MLSLYESFDVPDVPNVKIYRDDENPHRFYMVSERATVARDDEGKPLFNFILYGRNVDALDPADREIERGYLSLTTQAAVTKEAEDKIRAYLTQKLQDEQSRGFFFLFNPVTSTTPELGYPPLWLDGKVEFRSVPDSMVIKSYGSGSPSLIGTNVASFTVDLDQDGAEFFRQASEQAVFTPGVWYTLNFAAKIPAITITITGDRGAFYTEVKNYVRMRYTSWSRTEFLGITWSESRWTSEWDELKSISKFRSEFHNLQISIDDSSLPDSERSEMHDKLEDMAFQILQANILPNFFTQAFQDVDKEIKDPHAEIPVNESLTGSINITITRSEVVKKQANPSAILTKALSVDEIKANTVYLDLSNTFFQDLDVTVNANVNFTADPVFALKVFLDYDQQDENTNNHIKFAKELLFKSADQVGHFRRIMAKAADGSPKDSYNYWSEITYKDTGESIRIPATGSIPSRERQLVISYARLGFIKVNLSLGSMPDNIKAVQVAMRYPGFSGPSAQQSFELTKDKPTASFFTYTGQSEDPGPYHYQLTYVLADGQKMDCPEDRSQAESLTIPNPFERVVTGRFIAQADFSLVQKIVVDAHYADTANDLTSDFHSELINNGDSSNWVMGLVNPDAIKFNYDVAIIYKNGSREDKKDQPGTFNETIPVGIVAPAALEVTVIASFIDWAKYKLVVTQLSYSDPNNNISESKTFIFKQGASGDQTWKVLIRDKAKKTYHYSIHYTGIEIANSKVTEGDTDFNVLDVE